MSKINISLFFLIITLSLSAQEWTGLKIMDEQADRHRAESEEIVEEMTLLDTKGHSEVRLVRKYGKEITDDKGRFLIVFDSPKNIKGTALLTWEEKDQDADQWMYLPAQKRMQRIASGSKKGYFMGTDFTYEDLSPEDTDNFEYEIIKSTQISGLDCWIIKATPNNDETARKSGYKWRILYVLKKYFYTVKIEFYNKQGKKIKIQLNSVMKKINGTRYRTNKSLMTNYETGHKTLMEVQSRKIDQPIDAVIFTQPYITSERHIK